MDMIRASSWSDTRRMEDRQSLSPRRFSKTRNKMSGRSFDAEGCFFLVVILKEVMVTCACIVYVDWSRPAEYYQNYVFWLLHFPFVRYFVFVYQRSVEKQTTYFLISVEARNGKVEAL